MTTSVEDVSKLELAAQIVMAPPNQVTVQDRKDAEALFMQLREGALSVETCRQILESTQNQFFMFELARALVARMLKEWSKFTIEDVRTIIAYLLNFPVNHSNLPNFVSTEMFHSAAKIIKRSSLAMPDIFPGLIAILESLLSNENPQLQAYGLQTIELISTEFLSAWRSSNISISWDFHLRAKKQFEDILLKQLMQLSLRTLSNLMNSSDLSSQLDQQICDKFLRVASLIFCWNFSPKYLYLHFKILISALRSNTFRPPESWHDIFCDTTIITFFMELHSRVRYNEQLCQNSMLCLTQLSSLMGDALGPSGPIVLILPQVGDISERRLATSMGGGEVAMEKGAGDKKVLHDQYVQLFSHHLIELFSNYVLDYEMAPLSLVIYKLITCHPMAIFERFPQDLLTKFIDFIVANILRLTQPAMDLALKNDQTYHEPLTNLFQVWRTILRSAHMFNEEIGKMIAERNTAIIDAFIKSVLSPPFGTRTKPSNEEIFEESEEDEDDRTVFMDVLCDVGYFSLNSIDYFVEYISKSMVQRLGELHSVNLETINQEHLQIWQEDFHWLLLLTGYFIRQPAYSNIGNFPEELAIRCLNGFKEGEFTRLDDFEPLFTQCINNPPFDPSTYPHKLDPITLISTQILSWFSMEHQILALLDPNAPLLSPALCQTSLWQFSLLMIVLTPNSPNDSIGGGNPHEEEIDEEDDKLAQQWKDIKHLPSISPKSQLSAKIIQMALEKLFTILSKMSGEKRLCTDVIELLINFAEYRSEELATNDHLYLLLSKLPIENLPIRRQFVKSLVVIGSSVESNEVREKMNELILQPLRTRFLQLCQNHQSGGQTTESQLADYFECFTGVADAGQADNAPILFKFLEPIFDYCVPLIRSKSSFQLLIVSILDFIKSTTDVLFFYVESRTETMAYYNLLLAIINAYKETQLQRFVTFSSGDEEEEQQTQDLATLIEILCLSISKTYLPIGESGNNALESAKVSLHGLETLLPLMSEDLLKVPQLCTSFFRLLIFISDIAPGALIQVSEQMLNGVFGCVQMALDNVFGIERVRSALEICTNLSTFCLTEIQKGKSSLDNFMARNVLKLIPKIFELAMHFSCEMDIFNEATGALFSILQLDSDTFRAYVGQLLSFPANQDTKPQLEQAFTKLLTFSEEEFAKQRTYTASRKRNFQNKFQEFLVEVSGSLCLN